MKHYRRCDHCDHIIWRGNWGHFFCPSNYRVLRGFKYNGEPKKEKPTVHRWKTKKKSQFQSGWWSGSSVKKNWKYFTKRKHRAWQREMINQERYEEFHNRSYKDAEDLWSWD